MPNIEQDPGSPTTGTRSKWFSVALGGLAVVLALIGVDLALVGGLQPSANARTRPATQVVKVSGAEVKAIVYLTASAELKPGPDGKLHDAFSVTNFYARVGQPVKLIINNTDTTAHSITAPSAGVSILVKPGTHTYTLLVRKAGRFEWLCMLPCDPFSMSHSGYMRGFITVT